MRADLLYGAFFTILKAVPRTLFIALIVMASAQGHRKRLRRNNPSKGLKACHADRCGGLMLPLIWKGGAGLKCLISSTY